MDGVQSLTPSDRTIAAVSGGANMTLGVAATYAASSIINPAIGAGALLLGLSETSIGFVQVCGATLSSNPNLDAPIHQGQTLPGVIAYANGSPNAQSWDAVAGFVPGTMSGGNFAGVGNELRALSNNLQAGNDAAAAGNALQATDAVLDIFGVAKAVDATTPSPPLVLPVSSNRQSSTGGN